MNAPAEGAAALLAALGGQEVTSLADLTGQGLALAIALSERWDCDIHLVDLTRKGEAPEVESAWVAPYRAALRAAGVPEAKIIIQPGAAALPPVDLVLNLQGFGDRWKAAPLMPVLDRALHADSRLLLDIRKGSGTYPLLNARGKSNPISQREEDGKIVTSVLFRPDPPAELPAGLGDTGDQGWAEIARGLAGPEGFFVENGQHSFLFIPRGPVLVVTFDNLDIAMTKREDRRPWGFDFIARQGWSMLGVMAKGWTWYRDPWVFGEFDRLAAEGFFARFERVVFYGASMGGYAAAVFCAACPGADVVAISPQSTLDKSVVPWETRYSAVWGRDFSGKYGDAAEASRAARQVTLLYDPHEPLDAGHADRFTGPNVVRLRAPLLGHRLGSSLNQMGILSPIILGALSGRLTDAEFYRLLRARRDSARYQRELFHRAVAQGHRRLARQLALWALARGENRPLRAALREL